MSARASASRAGLVVGARRGVRVRGVRRQRQRVAGCGRRSQQRAGGPLHVLGSAHRKVGGFAAAMLAKGGAIAAPGRCLVAVGDRGLRDTNNRVRSEPYGRALWAFNGQTSGEWGRTSALTTGVACCNWGPAAGLNAEGTTASMQGVAKGCRQICQRALQSYSKRPGPADLAPVGRWGDGSTCAGPGLEKKGAGGHAQGVPGAARHSAARAKIFLACSQKKRAACAQGPLP